MEKSSLSMHAKECHQNNFSLNNFSVAVVRKVSPQQLRRQEFKFIDKFMAARDLIDINHRTLGLGCAFEF